MLAMSSGSSCVLQQIYIVCLFSFFANKKENDRFDKQFYFGESMDRRFAVAIVYV